MFEVEDGRRKTENESETTERTEAIANTRKRRSRTEGITKVEERKELVLTHRKPSVATQGYVGEDPSEINGARGDSGTGRVRSEIRIMQISACSLWSGLSDLCAIPC
jgi:hypothetical protein